MKVMRLFLVLGLVSLLGACAGVQTSERSDRQDVVYTCNCGPQCQCNSMSTEPGNCACGSPMKWGHVIKVEGARLCFANARKDASAASTRKTPPSAAAACRSSRSAWWVQASISAIAEDRASVTPSRTSLASATAE